MIDVKVGLGTLHTALPFILLYSFQKMGVFTLNSFGKITNYTKVLRLNLGVALGGVFFAIIGTLFKQQILLPQWDLSRDRTFLFTNAHQKRAFAQKQ